MPKFKANVHETEIIITGHDHRSIDQCCGLADQPMMISQDCHTPEESFAGTIWQEVKAIWTKQLQFPISTG
jgi:hypothetical protein